MWINPVSLNIYKTYSEIRQAYPNISFPTDVSDNIIEELGLFPIISAPIPECSNTQTYEEVTPILIDNIWTQQWLVRDLTSEEIKARVPKAVTPRQARLALFQFNLLSDVENWVNTHYDPVVKIEFEHATEFRRDWPLIIDYCLEKEISEEQMDSLFIYAATR